MKKFFFIKLLPVIFTIILGIGFFKLAWISESYSILFGALGVISYDVYGFLYKKFVQ